MTYDIFSILLVVALNFQNCSFLLWLLFRHVTESMRGVVSVFTRNLQLRFQTNRTDEILVQI